MDIPLERIVVPVAGRADAEVTCAALAPYLSSGMEVVVVHVVEKGGGGIDPAPLASQKRRAARIFAYCEEHISRHGVAVTGTVTYNTDVVEGILEAAANVGAGAVVFTPRDANRLLKIVSGDTAFRLVHRSARPILVLHPKRTTHEYLENDA